MSTMVTIFKTTGARVRIGWLAVFAAGLATLNAGAQIIRPFVPPAPAEKEAAIGPGVDDAYMRVVEDAGRSVALQIASRTFAPPRDGMPTVTLVGVAHSGDGSF